MATFGGGTESLLSLTVQKFFAKIVFQIAGLNHSSHLKGNFFIPHVISYRYCHAMTYAQS